MAKQDKDANAEKFIDLGQSLAENVGKGIEKGIPEAGKSMDGLIDELLGKKEYYQGEIQRITKEMEAAEEQERVRDYAARLASAKTAEEADKIRHKERLRLQKNANKAYLKELLEHLSEVEEKFKESQKQAEEEFKAQRSRIISGFEEIAQKATDSFEELETARGKMEQKMSAFAGLFEKQKITFLNSGPNGTKEVFLNTILDLSEEREQLEKYAALLEEVQQREDVPKELFHAIRDLSVEDAIRYQEALLALDDGDRAKYIADWEAIQKLSEQTAKDVYAEDTKAALRQVERELESWYGTIPTAFFQEGRLSAESFGEGFMEKLSSMKTMLQSAVQMVMPEQEPVVQGPMTFGGLVKNIQNSMTYILKGSGETVSEQLRAIRAYASIEQLREG